MRENGSGANPSKPCSVCGKVYSVSGRKVRQHKGSDGELCKGGQLHAPTKRSHNILPTLRTGWAGVLTRVMIGNSAGDCPEVRMWVAVLVDGVKDMVTTQKRAKNHKYAYSTNSKRYTSTAINASREFCLGEGAADICNFIEIEPQWFRKYVRIIEKHYA